MAFNFVTIIKNYVIYIKLFNFSFSSLMSFLIYYRSNLSTIILRIIAIGIENVRKFDFIDKPPDEVSLLFLVSHLIFNKIKFIFYEIYFWVCKCLYLLMTLLYVCIFKSNFAFCFNCSIFVYILSKNVCINKFESMLNIFLI